MKKVLAMTLAFLMIVSIMPVSAIAAENELNLGTGDCDYYKLIEKNDYNLAPGAVESEIVLNDESGSRRQVVHVIEVDPNNENISVMPSFKNISSDVDYTDQSNWGIMEMSKQAAHVENALGKNVVGAMNVCLSWDFTHPYGLLIYEGKVLCDNRAACDTCGKGHPGGGYLVIYKDGKAELRNAMEELTGEEWMAQTVCFAYLVKDGVNQHPKEDHVDANAAPRSVLGVKADGTLVIMMVDGRMSPYSAGFTNHEMAQMMLDLGCVDAINCDGGGSSTFITEREGSGELSVKSRFSDGAERATLTGILVVSKAVADGKFDHAAVEADNKLVTPGSTITFTATGADSAGGPADVPENVSWQLADATMGTIENGIFVSSGKTGVVTAQLVYNGQVVGEATAEVVIPDSFAFVMSNITAPYTKTVSLDLIAKYGYTEVALKTGDATFELSDDAMGTIVDGKFTATADESVSSGTVTATLTHNTALTATASITLGKGSEVVYDFESGAESISGWTQSYKAPYTPDTYYFDDIWTVVSAEEGKVRNGNYALKVACEGDSITCMNWCQTRMNGLNIDLTDAVSLSFWMYIPEGAHGYEWDFGNAIPVVLGHEFEYGTGWQYFTVQVADIGTNVTRLDQIKLYRSDTNNAGINYNHYEHPNYYADVTFYIDDITVNYSAAVDDNDAPVVANACVSHVNTDTPVAMKGQDVDANVVAFTANVTDDNGNTNYTGLDFDSLNVYVDGKKVEATCSETGMIATNDIELANGVHTVVFEIADNNGNVNPYREYSINVVGNANKNTIKYVPADPTLKDVANDSVVWMNIVSTAIEEVETVTAVVDLDQNSRWELDHMVVASGFTATYTIDEESNDATITIRKNGNVALSGETVLVSLPIRVWAPAFMNNGGNEDACAYRLISVMSYIQKGELVETTGNVSSFASAMQTITTEWNSTRLTSVADKAGWHIHNATAVENVAATCTTTGYTNRTFCVDCNSVVDWGEVVPASGHTYEVVDNKLVCYCGDILATTGLITIDDVSYYAISGNLQVGWQFINNTWYYFGADYRGAEGKTGIVVIDVVVEYTFESGRLLSGEWYTNSRGTRYMYGPSCYRASGSGNIAWAEVDGVTYGFNNSGYLYEGLNLICESTNDVEYLYEFVGGVGAPVSAIYNDKVYIEGMPQYAYQLIKLNGHYYYVSDSHKIAKSTTLYLNKALVGFTYDDGTQMKAGYYEFDAEGKMVLKNGPIDGFFYKNGVKQLAYQLVEFEGSYYYISDGNKLAMNTKLYLNKALEGTGLTAGYYVFDAEGKMSAEKDETPSTPEDESKNGVYGDFFYISGVKQLAYQLIEFEGNYYYISDGHKIAKNTTLYLNKALEGFTYEDGTPMKTGNYEFDTEGKMVLKNGPVDGFFYKNGVKQLAYQLVEFEGNYYYISDGHKLAMNTKLYLNKALAGFTYDDGTQMKAGYYEFDAEGKMVLKNGPVDGYFYKTGVKQLAYQLVEFDGNYYYISDGHKLAVNTSLYLNKVLAGTGMTAGYYEFDSEGKMIIK